MIRNSLVFSLLGLTMLCACSSAPVASPPKIVEIPIPAQVPVSCRTLRAVELPPGTNAQQVIERQHAVIVAYEEQVKACAGEAPKP